jgi:hypothetical protein
MSEYEYDDQGQQDIPQLREAAKRGETAAKERDEAVRKLALVEAGVDTKSPVGKLFTEAYKGALTEEAIQAAWSELAPAANPGNPAPPPDPEGPSPSAADLEETEARRLLTSNGASDVPRETPPPDPVAAGYEEYRERLAGGEGRDVASGSVFAHLIDAANSGDERAIWTGWTREDIGR